MKLPHESDRDQRIRPPAVLFAPLSTVSPVFHHRHHRPNHLLLCTLGASDWAQGQVVKLYNHIEANGYR